MIVRVGKYTFREHYVAFHLFRENIYCPWRIIGFYAAYSKKATARFMPEYEYIEKDFKAEAAIAGDMAGTREFLEQWRRAHVEINCAITKVICYCSTRLNSELVAKGLKRAFLGSNDPAMLAKVAIMVRSREKYFPVVFSFSSKQKHLIQAIKEAGLYDYA